MDLHGYCSKTIQTTTLNITAKMHRKSCRLSNPFSHCDPKVQTGPSFFKLSHHLGKRRKKKMHKIFQAAEKITQAQPTTH